MYGVMRALLYFFGQAVIRNRFSVFRAGVRSNCSNYCIFWPSGYLPTLLSTPNVRTAGPFAPYLQTLLLQLPR